MAGGGKGGSQSTSVQVPAWLEQAAQGNLARADRAAQIGYTPYYGPEVAAFTPMQQAAMQGTNQAASAFGMAAPTDTGMPQAQTFAGGVQGYSSAPMYEEALAALQQNAPGQYNAIRNMFLDPQGTGAYTPSQGQQAAPVAPEGSNWFANTGGRLPVGVNGSGGNQQGYGQPVATQGGGFTSLGDMFDGGGPGSAGNQFSGGPLSGIANMVTKPGGGFLGGLLRGK